MKRQFGKTLQRIAALTLGVLLILSPVAQAADNTGIGDVAGVGADLVDSNTFTLNASTPTLVKAAFLTSDNTALANNDILPAGTSVDFLIYLNNEADTAINDVTIQDTLVGFTYVASTIRVLNTTAECLLTLCDAPEELGIYNDVRVTAPLSDVVLAGDSASFVGTTVDVGNSAQANDQQNAAANLVLAVVFTETLD